MLKSRTVKKICVISPLGYTGMAYYDFSLCYALSELGLQVHLLTVDSYILKIKPNFTIKPFFINTHGNKNRILKGINYLIALITCFRFILIHHHDVIHIQKMEFLLIDCLFFLLLKITKQTVVYTPHDILPFKYNFLFFPLYLTYKLPDSLIAHNASNAQELIHRFGVPRSKIAIIPHGNYNIILEQKYSKLESINRLNLPHNRKLLLFFGCLRNGKGLETLVKAYHRVLHRRKDVFLVIVGKRQRFFNLDKISNKLSSDFNKNVELREGFVPHELVQYYYRAADLIVVPYEKIYESGVLKYAFSCARPTIVSDIPPFRKDAKDGENCFLFRKGDSIDLSNKIISLLSNKDRLDSIGKNAKLYSDKNWDWKIIAIETKKNYEKLVCDSSD